MLQVETSIFAMSFKQPPSSIPSEFDSSSCEINLVLSLFSNDYVYPCMFSLFNLIENHLSSAHFSTLEKNNEDIR